MGKKIQTHFFSKNASSQLTAYFFSGCNQSCEKDRFFFKFVRICIEKKSEVQKKEKTYISNLNLG